MRRFLLLTIPLLGLLLTACEVESSNKGEITVISPLNVEVGLHAGEFIIEYKIYGYDDVAANISTTADWLRIKEDRGGNAIVQHETNDTGGIRQAAILLSYEASKATIVVTQSNEASAPILTLIGDKDINIDRCGQQVVISYALENSNQNDYIYAKTSAEWIYAIDCQNNGKVELGIATNTSGTKRQTTVTVGYGSASFDVNINQAGDGEIDFNATVLYGDYYGDALTPGVGNYWFILSDRGFDLDGNSLANTTYYRIDAYAPIATTTGIVPIPNGTYTYDKNNTYALWTFTAEYSGYWVTDVNARRGDIMQFEQATLTVNDSEIILTATINGEIHTVTYRGDNALLDCQNDINIYTTLDADYEADLSDHNMVYECYYDYYQYGAYNWMFRLYPNSGSGDCFQIDIITGHNDKESGFAGNYVASDVLKQWSFIPGWTDQVNMQCSWFFTADQSQIAPFRGGEVDIIDNGDGTMTINIDVTDDRRNRITGTWTGIPTEYVGHSNSI